MKLVRAFRVDDEAEKVGVTHVCWDDEFEAYWPICNTPAPVNILFLEGNTVDCKKCLRLKLSNFRRVKRAIVEWANWG